MKTNTNIKKNTNAKRGPGRPKYTPIIPKSRFTINDLCEANGVNLETGKGKLCSRLTLIKHIARDAKRNGKSEIVRLKDTVAQPNSENGLGRKSFVYQLRSKVTAGKSTTKKTPKTANPTTQTYEEQKAALLTPTPAVTIAPEPIHVKETTPAPVEPKPVMA
jgi:hypothetical protein